MIDLNGMKWTVFCQTTRWCNWCLLFTTAERSLSTRHANGWSNLQIPIRFATVGTIDWYERNLTVVFRSARRWNWWLLLRQNVYWNILFGTCKICRPVLQLVGRLAYATKVYSWSSIMLLIHQASYTQMQYVHHRTILFSFVYFSCIELRKIYNDLYLFHECG
jgi:hypothetical protein